MPSTIPTVTLANGIEMPTVGYGVYLIPPAETERAVSDALEAGYRSIDTASGYQNEEAVGRAIAASGIPRDELFITTKLWIQDAGESNTALAYERSLRKLGLDYLDLYLIHQPFGDYYGAWRAMEDIYRGGRARAIGVSNFYPDRLIDLIDHNDVVPAVNQIETHPYFQRGADQKLMADRGVQIESWGPLGQGQPKLLEEAVLTNIANRYGKTVPQVILRWLVQRDVVVIPKSVNPERMRQNLDLFDFELTDDEMKGIAALDTGASAAFDHRDPDSVSTLGNTRLT
jgi:2,5-diketo-D-gluconate reductase A